MAARIGIIGAGWWAAHNHIPVVQAHGQASIAAVCRLGAAELRTLRDRFAIPYAGEDAAAILREVPLDGVIVASPHTLHAEHALLALQAGCHVLVEKPAATSTADAHRLRAEAARRDRGFMVPHAWTYKTYAMMARDWVSAGRIGEVRHIVCQMASPLADLFAGRPLAESEGHLFRPPPETWATPGRAGGYGWGQLTHALGLLGYVTDGLAPRQVTALAGLSPAGVDCYDAALIHYANGATGVLSGSATVPKGSRFQLDIRLFGTEGMLLLDVERERLKLRRHDGNDASADIPAGDGLPDGTVPVHRFIDLCNGRLAPQDVRPWGGVTDIEVLDAMYRAIASGRTEDV